MEGRKDLILSREICSVFIIPPWRHCSVIIFYDHVADKEKFGTGAMLVVHHLSLTVDDADLIYYKK